MSTILLSLKIRGKTEVVYDGDVKSVTSTNEKGSFDIIPYHTHFVSIVKEQIIIIDQNDKSTKIPVERGIVWVKDNKVEIYVGL